MARFLNVTDYWLVDDHLHFTMIDENGRKPAEHVISFARWICKQPLIQTRAEDSVLCYANEPVTTTRQARHPS
jgi:hypothetical protein